MTVLAAEAAAGSDVRLVLAAVLGIAAVVLPLSVVGQPVGSGHSNGA